MNLSLSLLSFGRVWPIAKGAWNDGWQEIATWPIAHLLRPKVLIALIGENGADALYSSPPLRPFAGRSKRVSCVAIALPDEMVLVRTIILPSALDSSTLSSVVAEEVRKSSPFGDTATDWGMIRSASADGERIKVTFALTSRSSVVRYLASKAEALNGRQPEVWVLCDEGVVTFTGYGERARHARQRWLARGLVMLCVLALAEVALIAISPYVQTRTRLFEANARYEALAAKASPHLRVRERFQQTVGVLDEANELLRGGRPDISSLLDELTRVIPDDTFISELRLRQGGRKINLTGETENASRLLQQISANKLFSEVKSTGASSRVRDRETFSLELTVSGAQ
ncbi:MAG: hypothetical protein IPL70_03145 [Uliginosibacterium sp.]|nr:hypothetical protein [Uliginosibacterium sp.]